MKKELKFFLLFFVAAVLGADLYAALPTAYKDVVVSGSVSVGNGVTAANSKAVLDLVSTSKVLLAPRMSTTQRNAISSTPEGGEVYDLTLHDRYIYNGTSWVQSSVPSTVIGDAGKFLKSGGAVVPNTWATPDATTGGTGFTTWALGDLMYSSATNTLAKLSGNTTSTKKFLTQTGTGSVSAAPSWVQPACADLSNGVASCSTDTTNAANISTGLLAQARGGSGVSNSGTFTWGSNNIAFTTSGSTSLTLPTSGSLGRLAGDTYTTTTLTSPAINGANITMGTASNSNRVGLPTNTTTNLSGLSNTAGDLAYDTTQGAVVFNSGSGFQAIGGGSGSGSGAYEFFTNGNAETNTTAGWNLYAGEDPYTDGSTTVGSAHVVHSRTTTNGEVIRGTASFKLAKDAANRKGEGFTFSIAADPAESNASIPVYFSFDYTTSSAYANGDIQLFAYDVTNSKIIPIQDSNNLNGALPASTAGGRFTGRFYSNAGSKSYRVSWHVATTNASAWNMFVDTLHVGGANQVPGIIVTPWAAWTSTFLGFGSVTVQHLSSRRVADTLEVQGWWTCGTSTGVAGSMTLGYNGVNGGVVATNSFISTNSIGGFGAVSAVGAFSYYPVVNQNSNLVNFGVSSASTAGWSAGLGTSLCTTGQSISIKFAVPIEGWTMGGVFSTSEAMLQTPVPLTASSAVKTPGATNNWHALSANSIALPPGTYRLTCSASFGNSGSVASYTETAVGWFSANGADTITTPAALSSATGLTVLAGNITTDLQNSSLPSTASGVMVQPTIVKTTAASTSVFCNTFSAETTAANARVSIVASAEKVPDFTTFSVYGQFEIQNTSSSAKTPTVSGNFNAMTGNSLTLTPGTWRLFGTCHFNNNLSNPSYTSTDCLWLSANGADTSASPASLSAGTGITVLTVHGTTPESFNNLSTGIFNQLFTPAPMAIIRCSQACTVYLDTYQTATTIANARVTAYVNAERLQ